MLFIFFLSLFIQLAFFYLVWKAFAKVPTNLPFFHMEVSINLPVSVVVCAHNELHNLKSLLPLLYQQTYPQKEIIIIDDFSTDGTSGFLAQEKLFHPELIVIYPSSDDPGSGKKKVLQYGIQQATHEIVLLTDADCRPSSTHWIHAMCTHFNDKNVQIVIGYAPYFKQKGLLNAFIQYETRYTAILFLTAALLGFPYMGIGRNLAYRKSLFMTNDGFNKHASIMGGDDDLFVNLHAHKGNTRVVLHSIAHILSIPQNSWRGYFKQKHRHLEAGKYYKFSDKVWLGTVILSHLFFWIFFCTLLWYNISPYLVIVGFLIRTICLIIVYKYVSRILNDQFNVKSLVILDFLFVIYYIVMGLRAFFFKRRRWK